MISKFLAVIAAVVLVSACSTAPEEDTAGSGSGATTSSTQSTTQAQPTPAPQPAGPAPGSQEDLVVNVGDRVFFAFDQSDISSEGQQVLSRQAAWMQQHPTVTVTVEGHCDERGTREYNLALGERRATAVKDYLVSLGINPNRIGTISYGKERPVALGSNESSWAQNRRGVTTVNTPGA